MTDNQTCYVCNRPCKPGKGLTDNEGRRHIVCPPPLSPKQREQRQYALSQTRSHRQSGHRTQANGIVEGQGNDH